MNFAKLWLKVDVVRDKQIPFRSEAPVLLDFTSRLDQGA